MQEAEKADLVSKYVDRIMEDMDWDTMASIVADVIWDEKFQMDDDEFVDEIKEYYPDLLPEGE